ncbi:MAG: hypothetical protein DRG78_13730, partial [Epsilonproteobacteria bacterium]
MHISLKELIQSLGINVAENVDNIQREKIDAYAPFLKVSDTFQLFTLEADTVIEDIEWLEKVFVHDYLFNTGSGFSAMMMIGIHKDLLNSRLLPKKGFISFSAINEEHDETISSVEVNTVTSSMRATLYDVVMTIQDASSLLKQVKKRRDGTLEILDSEDFTLSTDLVLTQSISGASSFELADLDTHFAIADTGVIVSLESMKYAYASPAHTLTLENAGITLPKTMLKKAEKNSADV